MNIIEAKNIGKKYKLSHTNGSYTALRDIIVSFFKAPFRKNRSKETFWALQGVNFEIQKGEVIGIIGRNGAGKSTLLKILSQITPPSTGEIQIHGTVGSLLEVGTGFHPELTGRENIYLNGAILGMKKKDIDSKFNDIVEFAGVEKFLDTPVKYYSSGMYVRLAFSVAAHMDSDILIIDEVLAVGDAEFQKKCLGKMEDITSKEGRTILFVSHNMAAIRQLCDRSILLSEGHVETIGETTHVIDEYLNSKKNITPVYEYPIDPKKSASITKVSLRTADGLSTAQIPISTDFYIDIEYHLADPEPGALLSIVFYLDGELLLLSSESDSTKKLTDYKPGKYTTSVRVPAYLFNVHSYTFDVQIHRPYVEYLDHKKDLSFEITDEDNIKSQIFRGNNLGKIGLVLDYKTTHLNK